jgi:hypothetical protein
MDSIEISHLIVGILAFAAGGAAGVLWLKR